MKSNLVYETHSKVTDRQCLLHMQLLHCKWRYSPEQPPRQHTSYHVCQTQSHNDINRCCKCCCRLVCMLMKITIRKTNCTIKYGNNNCICHLQLRDDQLRDDLLLWKQVVPHSNSNIHYCRSINLLNQLRDVKLPTPFCQLLKSSAELAGMPMYSNPGAVWSTWRSLP